MGKLPSFQFYPGDWMKDAELRLCSIFARGLLVDLLCIMFEAKHRGRLVLADGVTPWSDDQIADCVSGSDRETKVSALRELVANGVLKRDEEYGFVYSSRLLRDEEIRLARAEAGSKGGSKTQANNQAKSSSSSSTAFSSSTAVLEDKHIAAPAAVAERDASPPPYNLIASQYVAAFGGTTHITDKRRKTIRARWQDPWWRENWQAALDRGSQSDFLKGGGNTGWRISLDFFLKQDSVARILEGVYDNGNQASSDKRQLTAAERREQLNADSFQYLRDAVAAQQQRTSGTGIGNAIPASAGATLFLEEHGTAHTARG